LLKPILLCRRELCEQLTDMGCIWPFELKAAPTAAGPTLKGVEHAEASETIAKSVSTNYKHAVLHRLSLHGVTSL